MLLLTDEADVAASANGLVWDVNNIIPKETTGGHNWWKKRAMRQILNFDHPRPRDNLPTLMTFLK